MNVDCKFGCVNKCHDSYFLHKLRGEKFTQIIYNEAEYSLFSAFIMKINVSKSWLS